MHVSVKPRENILDQVMRHRSRRAYLLDLERNGGKVAGLGFVVELTFLNGRKKLNGYDVFSLLQYDK